MNQIPDGAHWDIPVMGKGQSERWHEFFSIPSMSMGIYKLPAGGEDPQSPHTEDEAYYIISGATQALEDHYRFRISGTARSIDQLISEIRMQQPDVVLINEWVHNLNILSAVDLLQTLSPTIKIIVMGGLADGLLIRDLFAYGVSGYLYKSDDLCDLLPIAVETVMLGRLYLSPTSNSEFLITAHNPYPHQTLGREDLQILQMLAHGDEVSEIADELDVSLRHVYWVREKLRKRFGARTNEHLIQRATAEGFIYPRN